MNAPCLLGLDLAWSEANPTGAAALALDGSVRDLRDDLGDDADILAWIRKHLGDGGAIGIDMPTIVRNAGGMRPCERDLHRVYGRRGAGAYPANLGLREFADGGRAMKILAELRADGVVSTPDIVAADRRVVAFEVYPHAAHLELFGLPATFKYKKKTRPWPQVLGEWAHYRWHLAALAGADPPLQLPADLPVQVSSSRYKRWEDQLDALTCAYVAAYAYRWGAQSLRIFGDLASGFVVVPGSARYLGAGAPHCLLCDPVAGEGIGRPLA
jgi:predicted RNase H-like nuclease